MPLPDERPRQSVANLIGRFEKRGSVPAISAAPSSRPSSVVSHVTGDSQMAEAKERREWPPASAAASVPDAASPPPPEIQNGAPPLSPLQERMKLLSVKSDDEQPSLSSPPEIPKPAASPEPQLEASPMQDTTAPVEATPPAATPAPDTSSKKPQSPAKPTARTAATKTASRTPAARGTPSKPTGTPARPVASTTSKTAIALKPQHTGASSTSNTSTVRDKPRTGAKSPLVTRAGAKTPTATRTAATASSTSSTAAPRPKTPGSGLFAPTKASLARAKNAQEAPAPVRKPTVSASAFDRLSKPTAASASKARTPVSSPPRGAGISKPARGAPPTRGALKPRVGLAGARMQAKKEKDAANVIDVKPKSAVAPTVDSGVPAPEESEEQADDDVVSDIESYDDAFASEGEGVERLSLDNAHIHGIAPREGAEEASFSFTPEPTPIVASMTVPVVSEAESSDNSEKIAEPELQEEPLGTSTPQAQADEPQHENGHAEEPVEDKVRAEVESDPVNVEVHEEEANETVPEETADGEAAVQDEKERVVSEAAAPETNVGELCLPTDEKASRPTSIIGSEIAGSIPDED